MTPEEIMRAGMDLMKSKAADYTSGDTTRYENFERQAEIISWFKYPIDQAFAGLIAVKLARLASLLFKDDKPNHESIEDTFKDLVNYSALWGGFRTSINLPKVEVSYKNEIVNYKNEILGFYRIDTTIDNYLYSRGFVLNQALGKYTLNMKGAEYQFDVKEIRNGNLTLDFIKSIVEKP